MSSKSITVRVSDKLSDSEELIAVANKLRQRALSGRGDLNNLRIGDEVIVKDLTTTINIIRVPTYPVLTTKTCNVCECEYCIDNSTKAVYYYTTYGMKVRKVQVCSRECKDNTLSLDISRIFSTNSAAKANLSKEYLKYHRRL